MHCLTIVGSAGAGADFRDEAAVAGEVLGGREAINRADFAIDDDNQDLGRSGDGLDELHGGGGLDALEDAIF